MNKGNLLVGMALILAMITAPIAWADSDKAMSSGPIQTMAQIVMHLNHRPSDKEKDSLRGIVNAESSNADERTLAKALINLDHHATAADREQLQAIMNNGAASPQARDLAEIIYNLNHKPSAGDKEKLRAMLE